ncbi:MAG: HupE/UreJ family protein [Bacteroidetes bacterium]|uniref:HupE/UreJ family protein n=1 Tax=Phaeocystidibacter marisrubri TaxID=1577780 RepID=A0A6L3ZE49_9FLAO|nr:HupE/UreJ family protein [Phaeocystidibacter marisrubri]KAB2815727.1 HupE/UreJ family protein [Phaeocystidibacter marisrubri]TNE29511.1 MAG: HupE/UreJ family protein [Bacteroidota bacterium]GGH65401.1 hypothetical protein GCM10011318_02360 [Phaeocystidibacter marisrubri]
MNDFELYFRLGYEHITDLNGMDHILFLLGLTAIYQFKHWGRLLGVVTAFTVGHTVTLVLAAMDVISVNAGLVEFLIPVTILITGLVNLMPVGQNPKNNLRIFIALLFGLVHGLGFSNFYRMMTMGDADTWGYLLPFGLGVEVGQLLIVFLVLLITAILHNFMRLKLRDWNIFNSGLVSGIAVYLMIQTWPF